MKNLKKVLSLVLALAMALSLMTVAFAKDAADFEDYDEVNYNEAVDVMVAAGVFNGTGDGSNFDADATLTREQAAKIITYMLLGKTQADKLVTTIAPYSDVAADRWSAGSIAYCTNEGILAGAGNGKFNPTGELDGLSFAKMLLVALGYDAQVEHMVGATWAINVAKLAYDIDLDNGMEINMSEAMTREEAAQMAFNAMKTPLVKYSDKGTDIIIDGVKVTFGAKEAEYVTTTIAKTQTISNTKLSNSNAYTIEFAEKYLPKLVLDDDTTDAFARPAHTWTLKAEEIGTYVNECDLTYTAEVEAGDIYKDLGLSKKVAAEDIEMYVDGKPADAVAIIKGDDTVVTGTNNGVLTEVWFDDEANTMIITQVNTYVGEITSVTKATAKTERNVTVTGKTAPGTLTKFETEQFAKKDMVAYTAAWNGTKYEIQTVKALEDAATGTLTEWNGYSIAGTTGKSENSFTAGGETYTYSANVYVDSTSNQIADFDVDESELNVYVDEYGYALYVTGVEGEKNYATVIGVGDTNAYGSQVNGATLLMPDGTIKEVKYTMADESVALTTDNIADDAEGDLVTYTVGKNDVYELTVVDNYNTDVKKVGKNATFTNGKSELKLGASTFYTTSETIFMVATPDGEGSQDYTVYTGYANMPSFDTAGITGFAVNKDSEYSKQIDVIYITAANLAGVSDVDTYFVKEADADIITNSKGSYYVLPAIVDGEETTVMVKASKIGNETEGLFAITNVIKDENGIITSYKQVNSEVFTAGNPATGTVAANRVVLGIGGDKDTATFWAYNNKTNVYVVDEDYTSITVSTIEAIATDANDHVYASNDSKTKVLEDVVIVEVPEDAEEEEEPAEEGTISGTMTCNASSAADIKAQADGAYTFPEDTVLSDITDCGDIENNIFFKFKTTEDNQIVQLSISGDVDWFKPFTLASAGPHFIYVDVTGAGTDDPTLTAGDYTWKIISDGETLVSGAFTIS